LGGFLIGETYFIFGFLGEAPGFGIGLAIGFLALGL
jgi:hypothetical protein